jgi:hypothetical protein
MANTNKKANWLKLMIAVLMIAAVAMLMNYFGLFQYVSMENIMNLKTWIDGLGKLGPLAYILLFIAACLFFLPGLPIGLLGGLAFGPIMGALWASIGSTLGAAAAFLVARYVAREMVEGWAQSNPVFKKIDDGVAAQGWRMLMITRLVRPDENRIPHLRPGLLDLHASRGDRLHLHGWLHRQRPGKPGENLHVPWDGGGGLRDHLPHPRLDQEALEAGGPRRGRRTGETLTPNRFGL